MYQFYKEKVKHDNDFEGHGDTKEWEKECVSLATYKRIFRSDFNLKFKNPKKDICKTCDRFQIQIGAEKTSGNSQQNIERLRILKTEQEFHHRQAEQASGIRDADTKAGAEGSVHVISFDLKKTFPLPKLRTNEAYYKCQLCIFNLGIQNLGTQQAHIHIWPEGIASRGAQEVSSCLMNYIKNNVNTE